MLRLTADWRTFVEGKPRKRSDGMESVTRRTVENRIKKHHMQLDKPFSWTQEELKQQQPRQATKRTPKKQPEKPAGVTGKSAEEIDPDWRSKGL